MSKAHVFDLTDTTPNTRQVLADQRMDFDEEFEEEDVELVEPLLPANLQFLETSKTLKLSKPTNRPNLKRHIENDESCGPIRLNKKVDPLRSQPIAVTKDNCTKQSAKTANTTNGSKLEIESVNSKTNHPASADHNQDELNTNRNPTLGVPRHVRQRGGQKGQRQHEPKRLGSIQQQGTNGQFRNYRDFQGEHAQGDARATHWNPCASFSSADYHREMPRPNERPWGWDIRKMELDRFAHVQALRQQELERLAVSLEHRERALREEKDEFMNMASQDRQKAIAPMNIVDLEHQLKVQSRELVSEKAELQKAIADHELAVEKYNEETRAKIEEQSQELIRENEKLQKALADHELRNDKGKKEISDLKLQSRLLAKEKEQLQKAMTDQEGELKRKKEEADKLNLKVSELTREKAQLQRSISEYDERLKRSDQKARLERDKLEKERQGMFHEMRLFCRDRDAFRIFAEAEHSRLLLMQSQFETEKLEHLRSVNQKMTELSNRDDDLIKRKKALDASEKAQQENVAAFDQRRLDTERDFVQREETLSLTQAFLDTEAEEIARAREFSDRSKQRLATQQQQLDTAKHAVEEKQAKQRKDLEEWISKAERTLRQQEESLTEREGFLETKDAELNRRETALKRRTFELNQLKNSLDRKRGNTEASNTENESKRSRSTSSTSEAVTADNTNFTNLNPTNIKADHPPHGNKSSAGCAQDGPDDVSLNQGFVLVDSDDDVACHKKAPQVVRRPVFDQTKRFNTYLDNDKAKEIQEKLFQEAAAKLRSKLKGSVKVNMACSSEGPPTITDPIDDIASRYPDHWKWTNPYTRLGLPVDSSIRLVKKQYRTLARLYHPDKSQLADASDRFNAISAAYHHLLNSS